MSRVDAIVSYAGLPVFIQLYKVILLIFPYVDVNMSTNPANVIIIYYM